MRNETVFSFIFFAKSINNFDDDVRISKRIFIPSRKLRGFVAGKIGPKDSDDFIGGNYGTAMNLAATLPNFMKDLENIDFSLFLDTANVWGVDYNSSLDSNKIRSSTGVQAQWNSPIGPMSFTFSKNITKAGIRAEHNDDPSPIVVFVARDHQYKNKYFSQVKEDDIITIRIIGIRFELNDTYISCIGEIMNPLKCFKQTTGYETLSA